LPAPQAGPNEQMLSLPARRMPAVRYVPDSQPDLVGLTLCGSPAGMIRWVSEAN